MNILLAHGSSDSRHGEQAAMLADRAAVILGYSIELRFLSSEVLPAGARVLPLLLGEGWHARKDIVRLAQASDCTMLPSLSQRGGPIASMVTELASELAADRYGGGAGVIFALYHFKGFEAVAEALKTAADAFADSAIASIYDSPDIGESITAMRQRGIEKIVVQPLALFEGKTMNRVREIVADLGGGVAVGRELTAHPDFSDFIAGCFRGDDAT